MKTRQLAIVLMASTILCMSGSAQQRPGGQGTAPAKLYNTAKQKLLDGKQVFSFTQSRMDIEDYCERAKHYDFAWFELQHSTLEFKDVEAMIGACPHAGAIPMTRLPDAQEWHIQHATDIGALGVIIPTVDDVERAREAVKWARFPPPTGVANAYDIASVPGVDVVIIGNNDLSSFTGFPQNDDRYQAMVTKIHDDVVRAGKIFGQANASYAKGHPLSGDSFFFQNGPSNDGWTPPGRGGRGGNVSAPPEGEGEGLAPGRGPGRGQGRQ